jgi:beta-mannanase
MLDANFRKLRNFAAFVFFSLGLMCFSKVKVNAIKYGDVEVVPKYFWTIYTPYEDALSAKDNSKIIETGNVIINYWLNGQTAQDATNSFLANGDSYEINCLWSTANNIINAEEALDDTNDEIQTLEMALIFADAYQKCLADGSIPGDASDMDFAKTLLQNKLDSYNVEVDVYAEMGDLSGSIWYGAKNEPTGGMYYGEISGKPASSSKNSSGTIIYTEFAEEDLGSIMKYSINTNDALDRHSIIEAAWNLPNEGAQLKSVLNQGDKIKTEADYLKSLNMPIFLRFGAEMNVWQTAADPDDFKAAFKLVADIMHQNAPNVAMVWSVNSVSAQGKTYDMFYPGDSYVDWVGVSLYTRKYAPGSSVENDSADAIYGTGKYANPLRYLQSLADLYGNRKPIIVTEGGIENFVVSTGEDLTNWATKFMRITYGYGPMVFPQLKGMFYFNRKPVSATESANFELSDNPTELALYNSITADSYFLSKGQTGVQKSYKKLGSATLDAKTVKLSTYAPLFTKDYIGAKYSIDGAWRASTTTIPYTVTLDLSDLTDGNHTLAVDAYQTDATFSNVKIFKTASYNVLKSGSYVVLSQVGSVPEVTAVPTSSSINMADESGSLDAYMILDNNYFKLRDIACVLSSTQKCFDVTWDEADNAIKIVPGVPYQKQSGDMQDVGSKDEIATPASVKVYVNDTLADMTIYNINGNNYFKLRDIAKQLDFSVLWDSQTKIITIDLNESYSES